MTGGKVYVRGELYLTLETVAELYQVQTTCVKEVYDTGLLGTGVGSGATVCIAAGHMDRVAAIVRWHVVFGLDLETIALTLAEA